MSEEELDKMRISDIDFFARRYSELFGEHFDRNTPEEKEAFCEEIKEELAKKAPKYVIMTDPNSLKDLVGRSLPDRIELRMYGSEGPGINVRIHELLHSYNRIDEKVHGLIDANNDLILKNLNEGTTEMFSEKIVDSETVDKIYTEETKLARFLTSIVGERTMLYSMRGNPKLLCETVEKMFGTQDFVECLEAAQEKSSRIIKQCFGYHLSYELPPTECVQMLSRVKFVTLDENDPISMLFNKVEESGSLKLYDKLIETDEEFQYGVMHQRACSTDYDKLDPEEPTLASVQQKFLKAEIEKLSQDEDITLEGFLELEIMKFLYDKISYQKHFLDYPEPKGELYELTPEDEEYSENFRSDLDGASERLGGRLGLFGPGSKVSSIEIAPHMIDRDKAKGIYLPDIEYSELRDHRLEIWAEKLNIAETKEILDEWDVWTYNTYYRQVFPDGDSEPFIEAIATMKETLDKRAENIIDKYKELESETIRETEI